MDEISRTQARNYLCSLGFFVITASFLLPLFGVISANSFFTETNSTLFWIVGIVLIVVGTLLVILHKRDMTAIFFFMIGFFQIISALNPNPGVLAVLLNVFMLLIALITITGKDRKKWALSIIPFVWFITGIVVTFVTFNVVVETILYGILAAVSLYYTFCCASGRFNMPGSRLLTAEEETNFKEAGSTLGYMAFAMTVATWAIYNFVGGSSVIPLDIMQEIKLLCGILMVIFAVLLFAVGKMRFTPFMFFMMALTTIVGVYTTGSMEFGIAVLFLITGLIAIIKKEARILPGIMLILNSIVFFILGGIGYGVPSVVIGILEIIVAALALYLSFAVYSKKHLPKF